MSPEDYAAFLLQEGGWKAVEDKQSKRTYFFNVASKERVWNLVAHIVKHALHKLPHPNTAATAAAAPQRPVSQGTDTVAALATPSVSSAVQHHHRFGTTAATAANNITMQWKPPAFLSRKALFARLATRRLPTHDGHRHTNAPASSVAPPTQPEQSTANTLLQALMFLSLHTQPPRSSSSGRGNGRKAAMSGPHCPDIVGTPYSYCVVAALRDGSNAAAASTWTCNGYTMDVMGGNGTLQLHPLASWGSVDGHTGSRRDLAGCSWDDVALCLLDETCSTHGKGAEADDPAGGQSNGKLPPPPHRVMLGIVQLPSLIASRKHSVPPATATTTTRGTPPPSLLGVVQLLTPTPHGMPWSILCFQGERAETATLFRGGAGLHLLGEESLPPSAQREAVGAAHSISSFLQALCHHAERHGRSRAQSSHSGAAGGSSTRVSSSVASPGRNVLMALLREASSPPQHHSTRGSVASCGGTSSSLPEVHERRGGGGGGVHIGTHSLSETYVSQRYSAYERTPVREKGAGSPRYATSQVVDPHRRQRQPSMRRASDLDDGSSASIFLQVMQELDSLEASMQPLV